MAELTDKELLEKVSRILYQWSNESCKGGWSTHQVDPQRKLASEIQAHLNRSDKPIIGYGYGG